MAVNTHIQTLVKKLRFTHCPVKKLEQNPQRVHQERIGSGVGTFLLDMPLGNRK